MSFQLNNTLSLSGFCALVSYPYIVSRIELFGEVVFLATKRANYYMLFCAAVLSNEADDGSGGEGVCFAGEQCTAVLTGSALEQTNVTAGHVLCHQDNRPVLPVTRFTAKLVLFPASTVPLTKGTYSCILE